MPFAQTAGDQARAVLRDVRHESLWLSTPDRPAARPAAEGHLTADLVVIGAGLSGLWTALRAKQRRPDLDVILLEGDRIAHAASGRNGGFLSASITHGHGNGIERWPDEFAQLHQMGLTNFAEIQSTIEQFDIDCRFEHTGDFQVATEHYQLQEFPERVAKWREFGIDAHLLDREQVRHRVDSPTYLGAIFDPDIGLVDPARLSWGLARAAESLGVRIFEHSGVQSIVKTPTALTLKTFGARITTASAALTTAAHRPLVRRINAFVVPVFDHVVATAPLRQEVLAELRWEHREGISDSGNRFHYYRLTPDNRILWGGYDAIYRRGERPGSGLERDDELTARLVQHLHDTFPAVAEVPIEFAWAGAIDTCSRFSAFWGTAYGGRLSYAVGHTGLGVGASRFGAEVLLDRLWGELTPRTETTMVKTKPLPFPPGLARQWVIDWTRSSLAQADDKAGYRNLWLRTLDRLGLGFDS